MKEDKDYLEINRAAWDQKTEAHIGSEFYDNTSFIEGRNSLNSIEMELLGDVSGLKILHLQCHFGQDSISLSRMGAKVTGVDFSEKAIAQARNLAQTCKTDTQFIQADIYSAPQVLKEQFDIVFTSYGTIGWLPDIQAWAHVVSMFLKPGGKFIFAEFHPVVWMFDDHFDHIQYNYFQDKAIVENEEGTYADKDAQIQTQSVSWNHSLSSVFTALVNSGIEIKLLNEFDYSPYDCFAGTLEIESGKFQIEKLDNKIPMVYSLLGVKS